MTRDGLVTVLDLAGRRIATLEGRVDDLERELDEVRADRLRLEGILGSLRAAVRADTRSLAPSEAD